MADAAPHDEDKARMEEALKELEPLPGRISALLLPGTARVTTNARVRSLLKFVEMELSAVISALRRHLALKEQGADRVVDDQDMKQEWLRRIHVLAARIIKPLLGQYERPHPCHAVLLHKAARCCCRRIAEREDRGDFAHLANYLALVAQHPLMYKHLLLVGDDTASTSSRTYHHLPYWLKLLLLYMVSMFPHGYKFDKNRLIGKWASEGLTGEHVWKGRVIQAEEYFSELVEKKVIIQAANYGQKPAAEAEDCRWQVNPDMLQFLASESADKGFVCTSGMLNSAAAAGGDSDSTEMLSRLYLHQPDPELPTLLETMDLSHTRSLAVSGAVDRIPLGKFIYLRVLDLEGWENLKDEDLRQICSTMFLLMYLSVRNTGVTRLPPEIKELLCLEALDVSHTKISELPPEACELEKLQTLDLRSTQVRQLPEQSVAIRWLRALLVGGDGINPDETGAKIPEGMVRTGWLEVLATVDLSEWSASSVETLGVLESLEVLAITWSFHQCADGRYQEALRSSIKKWRRLRSLTIHCGLGCSMEFLGLLDSPPVGLQKFKVTTGRFVTVPQWIKGLKHLSFLQITVCKLGADDLKILGELPKLQCLVLGLDFLPGKAIVIEGKRWFRQLRTFSVHCLVPCMTFEGGAMPELTHLDLEVICSVPPNQEIVLLGITNLEKLRKVVLGSLRRQPVRLEKFKVTTGRFVSVPQWIKGLEHLSFLQITVCKLGADDLKILGELPKLQCLVLGLDFLPGEAIVVRSEGFSQLRTFSVHCLVPWLTFEGGAMPELTHLDLEVICSVPPNQEIGLSGISNLEKLREVVLVSLDSPPKKLEKFKVTTGRFASVPQWIKGLEHLSFLQITVCKLGADDLKILGELPKLQCLVLGLDFLPGEAIVVRSEGFSQLRTFSVHCLVPWLTFEGGAMPELTHLDLEVICSVPPNHLSGISNLEKLREVVLRYSKWYSDSSSVKKTVQVVKNAVAMHRGPINLFINDTQHVVQAEAVDEEMVRTPTEIQRETEIEGEIESEAQMP